MRALSIAVTLLVLAAPLRAQRPDSTALPPLTYRTVQAVPVTGAPPVLDGRLDDPAWQRAPIASDLVEQGPFPGARPKFRTDIRVAYDAEALYLGIRAWDPHPDSIVAPLARRDDETNSDWIFVEIDSRHDRRSGFGFGVNPRGVQVDATFDRFINYDYAWDGVWEAVPRIDSLGWVVEYRIPFSQLDLTPGADHPLAFGLNVYRRVARTGESSDWSPRLASFADQMSHFNDIVGLSIPRVTGRLEVVPYTAGKATSSPVATGDPLHDGSGATGYAGADIRYHLGHGFTLTGAIHPDFGQVEADPSQVNLTTFETFLPEQRPFFIQGENDFAFDISLPFSSRGNSFASEQPFYSRRVGGPPHGAAPGSAVFADVPSAASLLGAAKLSGHTAGGWTIGALTAITGEATGRYADSLGGIHRITVDPLTGVGVVRIVREAADGAGNTGVIVTGLERGAMPGAIDDVTVRSAFTAGVDGRRRFHDDGWEVSGFAIGSRVAGSAGAVTSLLDGPGHFYERPDATYLDRDTTRTSVTGFAAQARIAKVSGNLKWGLVAHAISPGFDANELGFQREADWLLAVGSLHYDRYVRTPLLRHWSLNLDQAGLGWSFGGERRAADVTGRATFDFRNYAGIAVTVDHAFPALSLERLRGGPALLLPPATTVTANAFTDSRRPWQLTFTGTRSSEPGSGSRSHDYSLSLAWRVMSRLSVNLTPEYGRTVNGWQYVERASSGAGAPRYVIGRLDQRTAQVTLRADWSFTSKMTLQLYAQPFVSAAHFDGFGEVVAPRADDPAARITRYLPGQVTYDPLTRRYQVRPTADPADDFAFADPSFTERDLNASAVFRWEYSPGSTIYAVWTQSRAQTVPGGSLALGDDTRGLFRAPHTDVFLIKVSHRFAW